MKNRSLLLLLTFLLAGVCSYAGNGGKENRKEDPDMLGMVTADNRKPLRDVSVTAWSNSRKEKVVVSDVNGNFNLIDLKPGVYKFVFEKDGFKRVVREKVVLKTNEDYQMNIEMAAEMDLPELMPATLHFAGMS